MNKTIITLFALTSIVLMSCNGKQPKEVSEEEFFAKASEVNDENNYTRATVEYSASAKGSFWTGFQSDPFEKKSINGKYNDADDSYYFDYDTHSETMVWGNKYDDSSYLSTNNIISRYIVINQLKNRYDPYCNSIIFHDFFADVGERYLSGLGSFFGKMLFFGDYDNDTCEEVEQKYYVDGFEIRSSYVLYTYIKANPGETEAVNVKKEFETRLVWDNNGMLEIIQQKITILTGIAKYQSSTPEFPDGYNFSEKIVEKHTWKLSYK